ncbi:HK97-gp10 family putative phage morphogenesis protein [Consotaella aegiceratis]|uniref:HK97-gp10 family putative phage morphogenesis protein n=1 Tax=Consotaella aegiceratis TaxID=3097961 RepID=UPI002F3E8E89
MADDGGLSKLQKRFAAIPEDVRAAAQKSALKQADTMAATMRRLAPVDSGDLKESITVTPAGQSTPPYSQPGGSSVVPENAAAVTVGDDDVRYPHLVEYGTKKAPAHPFFWPAVRLHNKKAKAAIKSAIRRAVKKRGTS